MNGVSQATINYGYDCADELIAASNNASVPSCSSSNKVTNGGTNTQVGINYDADGLPAYTVVDGIQTLFGRDSDERVTAETFQPIPNGNPYGNLTYQYNPDGHMVDEGGSLAAITMPRNETKSFTKTDQIFTWNVYPVVTDSTQTNLLSDPSNGLTYAWDSRNQLTSMSGGVSETYDPTARRQASSSPNDSLSFLYDGDGVAGWVDSPSGNLSSFLTVGGAALAGSYTSGGTATTWVPLTDINGSTIGLVNSASPTSPPGATYTYDPSGNVSVNGSNVTSWPFQYQGMEREPTDPANLYFNPSSNVYNAQIQNMLSQVGAQGLGGSGGSNQTGNGIAAPSGDSGSGYSPNIARNAAYESGGAAAGFLVGSAIGGEAGSGFGPVGAAIGAVLGGLASFFEDLFSGGGSPPIPRQLMHKRHPLYGQILGIQDGLIPTEGSNEGSLPVREDEVGPSSTGTTAGTTALVGALEAAGVAEAAGGGPEDPIADVISAGAIAVGGAVATYEAYQAYSKGGKQNLGDTELAPLKDKEITNRAHDRSLSPEERRRYQREEKFRKLRNRRKRQ